MKYLKKFENKSIEKEVSSYLKRCLNNDKKDCRFNLKHENWYADEIYSFIEKDIGRSYILSHFFKKYHYDILEKILIDNFKSEFEYTLDYFYHITLNDYLIKKQTNKFNL